MKEIREALEYAKSCVEQTMTGITSKLNETLRQLEQALSLLDKMDWQPIDDEAKKEKRVDLFFPDKWRIPDCYWHRKANCWMLPNGYRLPSSKEPTHYRRIYLPDKPEEKIKKD